MTGGPAELQQAHDLLAIVVERDFGFIPLAEGTAEISAADDSGSLSQVTIAITWKVAYDE